jgi:hypothetical protein
MDCGGYYFFSCIACIYSITEGVGEQSGPGDDEVRAVQLIIKMHRMIRSNGVGLRLLLCCCSWCESWKSQFWC